MVYVKNIFKYFYIILTPIISFSDPGDLVEYNFQNTFSISTLNIFLNSLGNNTTNVMYPISVYDIKYESIDHNGEVNKIGSKFFEIERIRKGILTNPNEQIIDDYITKIEITYNRYITINHEFDKLKNNSK